MIQEILGCCWIKYLLIKFPEEEILKLLDTEYIFSYWLTSLNKVASEENFLASDPMIFEKARNIVRKKKFDSHNPEIISLCNSLLGYCNEYDAFPQNVKYRLQREWKSQQILLRNIPITFRSLKSLLDLNACDYKNVISLFDASEECHHSYNPFYTQSTISWLINRYPKAFQTKETRTVYIEGAFYKLRTGNHVLTMTKLTLDIFEDPSLGMKGGFRKKNRQLLQQLEKFGTPEETIRVEIENNPQKNKRKG